MLDAFGAKFLVVCIFVDDCLLCRCSATMLFFWFRFPIYYTFSSRDGLTVLYGKLCQADAVAAVAVDEVEYQQQQR